MKEWSHDHLHDLIDANPTIKELSGTIHATVQPELLDDALRQKVQMIEVYAISVGCRSVATAIGEISDVFTFLNSEFETWSAFRVGMTDEHVQHIREISKQYREKGLCHAPNGNNYICYCDEI